MQLEIYSCTVRTVQNGYVLGTNIPGYPEKFYADITSAARDIITIMNTYAPPPTVIGTFTEQGRREPRKE